MEWLTDWVRQIVFFVIFITFFYQLVADKKYRSYIKFFASLVLILLTVNPLFRLFDMQKQLDFNRDLFAYPQEVEEFRMRAEQARGQQYEEILAAYRQTVEEQLEMMAGRLGLYVSRCGVELSEAEENFGQVTMVTLTVTRSRLAEGTEEGYGERFSGESESREDSEGEGGTGTVSGENPRTQADSVEEIREVRISPITLESQDYKEETEQIDFADGNQDTGELEAQIARLYQLKPEQVSVSLEE